MMVSNVTLSEFLSDDVLTSAVRFQLMVAGEACGRLSPSTVDLMADAPFDEIRGFRNRLVHGYFAVDLAIVWEVATVHLPELSEQAEYALAELFPTTHEQLRNRRSGADS